MTKNMYPWLGESENQGIVAFRRRNEEGRLLQLLLRALAKANGGRARREWTAQGLRRRIYTAQCSECTLPSNEARSARVYSGKFRPWRCCSLAFVHSLRVRIGLLTMSRALRLTQAHNMYFLLVASSERSLRRQILSKYFQCFLKKKIGTYLPLDGCEIMYSSECWMLCYDEWC